MRSFTLRCSGDATKDGDRDARALRPSGRKSRIYGPRSSQGRVHGDRMRGERPRVGSASRPSAAA
jgi:hypothetical protein